jgi:hypothetical protein
LTSGRASAADRFDGPLEDVFDLQDKVATSVAGVIEPTLQAAETSRSANRPTGDLTAYDLYLRGYTLSLSSATQFPEALRLMEGAIARDPASGPALAWAAYCCDRMLSDDLSEDPAADRRKGAGKCGRTDGFALQRESDGISQGLVARIGRLAARSGRYRRAGPS